MAGSAMPTTVASRAAMPEPSTVAVTTHRPGALDSRRAGLPAYGAAVWLMCSSPGIPRMVAAVARTTDRSESLRT